MESRYNSSLTTSPFDLYKIGVGPSSSHTMGPMLAACRFARGLGDCGLLDRIDRVQVELYGSLALTGLGHATDRAVLLGLAGNEPATIDPAAIDATVAAIRVSRRVELAGARSIHFDELRDLLFHRDIMFPPGAHAEHPNGLRATAFDAGGAVAEQRTFFPISGAEVGCQGEVGVACSMAAAGLTAALGGSNGQVEHTAEIAMEHNLGMTCDPIGGLVQIPYIERNAMGAAKTVQASRIALNEQGEHKVSLDQVIRTMYLTGLDMQSRYKETSLAGLALNRIEC